MENYELTIETIEDYKDNACWIIRDDCDKCDAMYECNGNRFCCFDTVIRFVEYANKHEL